MYDIVYNKRGFKMEQDKMYLINKIFDNETIRTVWIRKVKNTLLV